MSITVPSFAAATGPSQQTGFNPAFAGNLQAPSGSLTAVSAEATAEFDTSAKLSLYLTIYIDILDTANNQDFPKMKLQISHFKSVLTSQLTESFKTLLLMRKMGGPRTDDKANALRFHHDMVAMGGKILPLLNRYDAQPMNEHSITGLLADLADVGEVLMAA